LNNERSVKTGDPWKKRGGLESKQDKGNRLRVRVEVLKKKKVTTRKESFGLPANL